MTLHESTIDARSNDRELLELRTQLFREVVVPAVLETQSSLNDMQVDAMGAMGENLQADQIVDLPTRSGKSFLIRAIAEAGSEHGISSLIVAPRKHILREHSDELAARGVEVASLFSESDNNADIVTATTQSIAVNREHPESFDHLDVVLIDEGHKALGEKTREAMRALFPNAVRIAFTASPDYADDRSVTDEYGQKLISRSVVEAIETGKVAPVRAFLYKTNAVINYLDPAVADFTPRELERVAQLSARNTAIADIVEDLVTNGRQGLITTIPGENLLHADKLKQILSQRQVVQPNGLKRPIYAEVVRGNDPNIELIIEQFNEGVIDVLLYCDLLREGFTSPVASFLVNGRPTTSIVNITQDIGRVLNPKEIESVVVDFLDESVKQQRTVYDVLELDRSTQGVFLSPQQQISPIGEPTEGISRDTYMRALFREEIVNAFKQYDERLIAELHYVPKEEADKRRKQAIVEAKQRREFAREQRKWESILKRTGLPAELPSDTFTHSLTLLENSSYFDQDDEGNFHLTKGSRLPQTMWPGFRHEPTILPVVLMAPNELEEAMDSQEMYAGGRSAEEKAVDANEVARLLGTLVARKKGIIEDRFGLLDDNPKTLDQVGEEMGISRERVRGLETDALSEMRHPTHKPQTQPQATSSDIEANRRLMIARDKYFYELGPIAAALKVDIPYARDIVDGVAGAFNLQRYDFYNKQGLAKRVRGLLAKDTPTITGEMKRLSEYDKIEFLINKLS